MLLVIRLVTYTGSALWLFILGVLTTLIAIRLGQLRRAGLLWIAFLGSSALNQALKLAFVRPRPPVAGWLTHASGWSFPSGHAMNAVVFYGMLAYLLNFVE